MGIVAGTNFDCASTGNDNNGGGFVPGASGTDYSQQDSPQYALTGVTSSGAGNVVLTASAAADMVGNILQVVSGTNFNTGLYQITSVSVGVSITVSINNSGTAISTGTGSSGVMNVGGRFANVVNALTKIIAGAGDSSNSSGYNLWVKGTQ